MADLVSGARVPGVSLSNDLRKLGQIVLFIPASLCACLKARSDIRKKRVAYKNTKAKKRDAREERSKER